MNNFVSFCLLLFSLSVIHAEAGEISRCIINGKTVYTNEPCGNEPTEISSPQAQEKQQYVSSKWYYNANGYKQALKVSKYYDVPIFIYYQADWCPYCRKLERELLHTSSAKKGLRYIVKVQITPDDGRRENALFDSMGGTGYPTIFIQKSAMTKPVRRSLMTKKGGQWRTMSPGEFTQFLSAL